MHPTKLVFLSFFLFYSLPGLQAQKNPLARFGVTEEMNAAFPVVERMFKEYAQQNHFPGIIFGIVVDGKLVFTGAQGVTDVVTNTPVSARSDFRIASMTKSFTAMAILQLRDAGKLSLDDPAWKYIPELKDAGERVASDDRPASDAPPITIRHLLSHSAGFPEDNPWGDRQLAITDSGLVALVLKGIAFSNSPGIAYEYSNLGFALLGHIVQRVSGEPYEKYITEHILRPLGMNDTYWEFSEVPAAQLAHGYRWLNGSWVEQPMLHDGAYGAMGGLITTLADFARYEAFQLDAWPSRDGEDGAILRRSSRREMQQPWVFGSLNTTFSYPGGPACPLVSSYCYGLRWNRDCKGRTMVGHSGGLPGFGSNWTILPDYGVGIISFANLTYAPTGAVNLQVLDSFITLAKLRPRPVPVSPILEQRKKELATLLPEWEHPEASGIFAVNFFLDYFRDSLRKEARSIFAQAGKIKEIGEMRAENGLRGSFLLKGEKADVEVRFTLTPENPPLIQEYHIRLVR
jgi:CubicO group peptidase (beta-lactamase class C family)